MTVHWTDKNYNGVRPSLLCVCSHWTARRTHLWCCCALACACWDGELWEQQLITCPGCSVIPSHNVMRTESVYGRCTAPTSTANAFVHMINVSSPFISFRALSLKCTSLLSITAIWSLSFMGFMHYSKGISASLRCAMSGSSPTWNCSGRWWCLESECLSNYTRCDFPHEAAHVSSSSGRL